MASVASGQQWPWGLDLGLGSQVLYSITDGTDNIIGGFTKIESKKARQQCTVIINDTNIWIELHMHVIKSCEISND